MRQEAVKTAVSRFAELPAMQRSVVILKDVLDERWRRSLRMLDLTVDAVKAHLARGRAGLREINAQARRCSGRARRHPRWPAMWRVQPARLGRAACDARWRRGD